MIQLTPATKVFVCISAVDFRLGINGIFSLCESTLKMDPYSGTIFAFIGKSRKAIKLLVYDGQGFWLMQKRLSRGRFSWWPSSEEICAQIDPRNFLILINNGNPAQIKMQSDWKKL